MSFLQVSYGGKDGVPLQSISVQYETGDKSNPSVKAATVAYDLLRSVWGASLTDLSQTKYAPAAKDIPERLKISHADEIVRVYRIIVEAKEKKPQKTLYSVTRADQQPGAWFDITNLLLPSMKKHPLFVALPKAFAHCIEVANRNAGKALAKT